MTNNFSSWLQTRDQDFAEALGLNFFRQHPKLSKSVQLATLTGALNHGAEAMPHFDPHATSEPVPITAPVNPAHGHNAPPVHGGEKHDPRDPNGAFH
jgi:hypothetical protein